MTQISRLLLLAFLLAGIALPARADLAAGRQAYDAGNYAAALAALKPLADKGDAAAQHLLGKMYASGDGVGRDYAKAAELFQSSAEQGYAPAMADLGDLYFDGRGVRQDRHEALRWYRQAAEKGDPDGEYDYGLAFHDGDTGHKPDFNTAMMWFAKAASQGHAAALNMIGYMHDLGEGVHEDAEEAVRWYRKAADKGYVIAQYNLALMYQDGRGVAKDLAAAARWFRKAAERGDADAQAALGYMCEQGLGIDRDIAQAIRWYADAARQHSSRALNNLGVLYQDGSGLPRDRVRAYVLYSLASDEAESNSDRKLAEDNRSDVAADMSSSELAAAKTLRQRAAEDIGLVLPVDRTAAAGESASPAGGRPSANGKNPEAASNSSDRSTGPNDSSALVATVKMALAALGYDTGARDDGLNDKTVAAIKAFQKNKGIAVTGEISADLLAALLAARFEPGATKGDQPAGPNAQRLKLYATGSGFYVTGEGDIVTNQHVIDECVQMRLPGGEVLQVLAVDSANDLALLKAPIASTTFVRLRDGRGIRTGDSILIAGFPLRDEISSELNVTTGNVSSLAGPDNDRTLIQITAPVQHGNSGGPVLDQAGHLVGVVQSKFDPTADTESDNSIDVPQNVNFAVSANLLRSFLDAQGVDYETELSGTVLPAAEIAGRARKFTVSLECWQ